MGKMMTFDFSDVELASGPTIKDIPLKTDLNVVITGVSLATFNGVDKFVIQHEVFIDPNDESQIVQFRSYIGPNHGWLLAQYLAAAGENIQELSGQGITEDALEQVLKDLPVIAQFSENVYQKNGETKRSTQINRIRPMPDA